MFSTYSKQFSGEGLDLISSLDSEASRTLFAGVVESKPTLESALIEAGFKDYDITLENSVEFSSVALRDPEIASLGLTDDEAGAISCYTLEGPGGTKAPYAIINECLSGSRDRASLFAIRKLLYLLLSGLRKLPRSRPSAGQIFYRGITQKVPIAEDEANGHQFYAKGRTVTWRGFTSTTTNFGTTNAFLKRAQQSTLFNIGGKDLWGYSIKKFSLFPNEEEILLEPETRVLVTGVIALGDSLLIDLALQQRDRLVLEDIIPVRVGVKQDLTQRKQEMDESEGKLN